MNRINSSNAYENLQAGNISEQQYNDIMGVDQNKVARMQELQAMTSTDQLKASKGKYTLKEVMEYNPQLYNNWLQARKDEAITNDVNATLTPAVPTNLVNQTGDQDFDITKILQDFINNSQNSNKFNIEEERNKLMQEYDVN